MGQELFWGELEVLVTEGPEDPFTSYEDAKFEVSISPQGDAVAS